MKQRKMKVVKYGEVKLRNFDVRIGYDNIDSLLVEAFPLLRNLTEDIVFNGKITIIVEELTDEQCENTFELPATREDE